MAGMRELKGGTPNENRQLVLQRDSNEDLYQKLFIIAIDTN